MNREEEIKQVAENYTSQMCKNCSAMLYCEEKNKKCVERREQENVFADGYKWADNNPDLSSLWHSADEEPQGNNWKILCQDEENGCWVENRTDAIDLHNTWNEYVEIEMVVKWAYISDLLPKGGKE